MALIITGSQGSGVRTFAERAYSHDIGVFVVTDYMTSAMLSHDESYESLLGPSRVRTQTEQRELYEEGFGRIFQKMHDEKEITAFESVNNTRIGPIWTSPAPHLTRYCMNKFPEYEHTHVLITCPRDVQVQRIFDRDSVNDPRFVGKSNAFFLAEQQISAELDVHEDDIEELKTVVDYHIHNDGELNQYYAAIDQVLNAENLLT